MSREWKPGDMARTLAGGTVARTASNRWILLDDGHPIDWEDDSRISRPLVVIDPEDREQIQRLRECFTEAGFPTDTIQAALREFANPTPPRPDEPLGLGAVVDDEQGRKWVRSGQSHGRLTDNWRLVEGEMVGWWSDYDALKPVRVLSPGYTEDGA